MDDVYVEMYDPMNRFATYSEPTILLVAFDEPTQQIICRLLEDHGLSFAHHSAAVLETTTKSGEHDFDLVLVSWDHWVGTPQNIAFFRDHAKGIAPLLFVSDTITVNDTVDLMRNGAQGVVSLRETDRFLGLIEQILKPEIEESFPSAHHASASRHCLLEQAMNHLVDAVVITDDQFAILYVNGVFEEIFNCAEVEILGKTVSEFLSKTAGQQVIQDFERNVNLGLPFTTETQPIDASGEIVCLEWLITPIHNHRGEIVNYVGAVSNVTQQRSRENQLHFHSEVLHHMAEGVAITRVEDGRLMYVNDTFAHMFGYEEDELVGMHVQMLTAPVGNPESSSIENIMAGLHKAGDWRGEVFNVRKDRSTFWTELTVTAFEHTEFGLVWIGIQQDITDRIETLHALQESETRFRNLIDSVNAHFYVFDVLADEQIVGRYLSQNIERFTGYPLEKFLQDWSFWPSLIHPDDLRAGEEQLARLIQGIDSVVEYRVRTADGGEIWIQDNARVVSHTDGAKTIYATMVNITQFKQAQETLRLREAQFQAFMRYLPGAVFIKNREGYTLYCNEAYANVVGKEPKELIGKHTLEYVPPATAEMFMVENELVFESGEAQEFHHAFPSQDQDRMSYWLTIKFPIYLRDDETVIGVISVDVTKEKEIEAELRKSEHRYREMFERHGLPQYILDAETKELLDVNESACQFYGYTKEQFLALNMFEINMTPREASLMQIDEIFQGDRVAALFTHRKANGELRQVEAFVREVEIDGRLCHQSVVTDVTETLQAKKALQEAHDLLELRVAHRTLELERAKNRIEAIFNTTSDGIVLLGADYRIQQANRTFDQLFNTSAEHYVSESIISFVHDDYADVLKDMMVEARLSGLNNYIVVRAKRGDSFFETEMSLVPTTQLKESGIYFVCTIQDVTERVEAEQALRSSERLLRQMAANYPNSYMSLIERDYTIGFTSGREFHKLGLDPNQFVGLSLEQVFGENTEFVRQKYIQTFAGEEQTFEMAIDGQYHLYRSVPIYEGDGTINRILSVVENTTERKTAEIALRDSEARYRLLAENVTDMISRHEIDGTYIYVTPSAYKMTGYMPEELIGRVIYDFIHPEDLKRVQMAELLGEPDATVFTENYRWRKKNGVYIWLEATNHVICDADSGMPQEMVAVSRDVSARKEAEFDLESLSQRLQLATGAGKIGVWDWNLIDDHLIWDERMFEVYQIDPETFTYTSANWESKIHPDDRVNLTNMLKAAIYQNRPYEVEFRIVLPNNERRYLREQATIIRDENGRAQRMIGVNIDITERMEAEKALLSALEAEKELGDLKSRFVSIASHEFRTPLASILAATETISVYRSRMSEEQLEARLTKIRQQVNYMKDMMDDVLQLARIQAHRIRFDPAFGYLDALCLEIVEEFDAREEYHGRVIYSCDDPTIGTDFDARLMRHVIVNLVSNALKYSDSEEEVTLSLSMSGDKIEVSVVDKGIGIPEKDVVRLGEPFHRAENVGTISGTGLGLSITKGAVQAHDGELIIDSELGEGSTFTVLIPKRLKSDGQRQDIDN